jgi:hypothetical protein
MRAVWLVRGRELAGRLRFWTAIVGYDPRDRSFGQSIYLVYVLIFFTIWGLAVLAFLADLAASLLLLLGGASPAHTALLLVTLVMLLEFFIQGYTASRRSPYLFSDADSELICQSPVDRGFVALAWFLGDWLLGGLVITSLAIVLRFALFQLPGSNPIIWQRLPYYIFTGLQTGLVVLPIHLALIACVFALGSLRLRSDRDLPWLPWAVVAAALGLAALLLVGKFSPQLVLWLVVFPLQSAFAARPYAIGLIFALLLALTACVILYLTSSELNLSRAAQESRYRYALRQAGRAADARLSQSIRLRQKLRITHPASTLPGHPGRASLLWKGWIVASRSLSLGFIFSWAAVFALSFGLFLVADWGSRLWIFVVLCYLVGQRCTARLRADLEVWFITRQLPFSTSDFLYTELIPPAAAAILLACLAMIISHWLGNLQVLPALILAPIMVLLMAITSALDALRNTRGSELLVSRSGDPGILGVLLGLVCTGIPLGLVAWMVTRLHFPGIVWVSAVAGLLASLGIGLLLWGLLKSTYQHIS